MSRNRNRGDSKYRFRYYLAAVAFILTLINFAFEVANHNLQLVDSILVVVGCVVFVLMKTLYDQESKGR